MALLTYDWHPPDPTGAVNAYLSGMKVGVEQAAQAAREREVAQKLAADALDRQRLTKRFAEQHALQLQQEARLAGAEQLRQGYHAAAAQQKAADILAQKTAADNLTSALFPGPELPTGGVASPGAAQSMVAPDPLVGQPPPTTPQDDLSGGYWNASADIAATAPSAPTEMLSGPPRGASDGLPVASATPLPPNPLLDAVDGYSLVGKPAPGAPVPRVAMPSGTEALFNALPPKEKIALSKQLAGAQIKQAIKPVATPKPDPIVTLADGQKARVAPDNTITPIGPPKPVATPAPMGANTERDNYTGDARRFAAELGTLTKGLKPVDLGYAWNPKGTDKWYRMGDPHPISKEQAAAQNVVAQKVEDLKAKIEAAEKKAQAIDARGGSSPAATPAASAEKFAVGTTAKKNGKTYLKTAQGWVEQ